MPERNWKPKHSEICPKYGQYCNTCQISGGFFAYWIWFKWGLRYREWYEGVDDAGNDPLLDEGQEEVESHHDLAGPPQQEHLPDPETPREVQLVAQRGREPEVVDVEHWPRKQVEIYENSVPVCIVDKLVTSGEIYTLCQGQESHTLKNP